LNSNAPEAVELRTRQLHSALTATRRSRRECKRYSIYPRYSRIFADHVRSTYRSRGRTPHGAPADRDSRPARADEEASAIPGMRPGSPKRQASGSPVVTTLRRRWLAER
jgi:hypothetical protein